MSAAYDASNVAIYTILPIYLFLMMLNGAFSYLKNNTSGAIATLPCLTIQGQKVDGDAQNFLGAGKGLSGLVLFFTMAASLFSGYSVSGIANESYTFGFCSIRWIPAGVALYGAFMFLAPRLHALGKSRGYLTIGEFIFDRFAEPASSPFIPHSLRLLSLFCLQLPVFTYLITQFTALAVEINIYTGGEVSKLAALLTAAAVLLFCSLVGGLRAVAYNDVLQGILLLVGSIVFFIIQQVDLGGMSSVKDYVQSEDFLEANGFGWAKFNTVPNREGSWSTSSHASFIIKVMLAATMFPHLVMRLFLARDAQALRTGLAGMNFTFFIIQLSSMVTGWVAINIISADDLEGAAASGTFGAVASEVRSRGAGGEFASACLVTAAVCAMLSTADSSLIAFSTMWLRDFFLPYVRPSASQRTQVIFSRATAVVGLAIGVFLARMAILAVPVWDLSRLFSLQTVTPIHVVPASWLGLHWKGLRGEAVLAGMVVGLGVTFGLTFSELNVKLALGLDEIKEGWSCALIGFGCNLGVTVLLGALFQAVQLPTGALAAYARPLDLHKLFGERADRFVHPAVVLAFSVLVTLTIPVYLADDFGKPDHWVGNMPRWAFLSLLFTGVLAVFVATAYHLLWTDYQLEPEPHLYPEEDRPLAPGPDANLKQAAAEAYNGTPMTNRDAVVHESQAPAMVLGSQGLPMPPALPVLGAPVYLPVDMPVSPPQQVYEQQQQQQQYFNQQQYEQLLHLYEQQQPVYEQPVYEQQPQLYGSNVGATLVHPVPMY